MSNENSSKSNKKSKTKLIFLILVMFSVIILTSIWYLHSNNMIIFKESKIHEVYVDLGEFTVGLNDTSKNRYFKGKLSVGYNKKDSIAKKQLAKENKLPVIKDIVNNYFRNRDYDFFNDLNNEKKIKQELLDVINKNLQDFKIIDIRFSQYLLQ
ncbi:MULTISPECIES: flagellar basal body-associated FliL family protein [Clostridium]|uniref:flagellar basal body-associated FliL family protein n=1 Tax=Clostridium TaxID=1485 RepID=UPI000CF676E9|nr:MULTISPECIES: flagellar basal body-associated FliL family protein [Clostridium]